MTPLNDQPSESAAAGPVAAEDPLAALFPAPTHLGRRRPLRRLAAGGAAAAVLLGAVAASRANGADGGGFRTATVASRPVEQVLDGVATVEPVDQARVAFPVAGTVSSVAVSVGDEVIAGQTLAALDPESLEVALHEQQAALAQAELRLEQMLNGEAVTAGSSTLAGSSASGVAVTPASAASAGTSAAASAAVSTTASAAAPTTAPSSDGSGSVTFVAAATSDSGGEAAPEAAAVDVELRSAQQAVLDAKQTVDASLATSSAALDSATSVCEAVGRSEEVTAATVDVSAADSAAGGSTPATTIVEAAATDTLDACRQALVDVLAAQRQVATDEDALVAAATALTELIEQRALEPVASTPGGGSTSPQGSTPETSSSGGDAAASPGTPSAPSTGTGSGAAGSTPSASSLGQTGETGSLPTDTAGSGSAGAAATYSPSAEQLIAGQADIDAAAAQVAVAEQAIDQATVVSPIAGTVVSVDLAAGDEVTAADETASIVVVGEGGYEVTTTVSVDDVADVAVGQGATVVADGGRGTVVGEVVSIGVSGSTGSDGTTSYPVTIALTGDTAGLGNGSTASVSIVTDDAVDALAVPASAVTVDGDRSTVQLVEGDEVSAVTVEVGARGGTWVEVLSGVEEGDEVALADLSEPLPSAATDSSSSTGQRQGQGGFPGAGSGGPPAGFSPPGAGG